MTELSHMDDKERHPMSTTDGTAPRTVIRSRTGTVLHTSEKATVRAALTEAAAAGSDLRGSNLSGSNLSGSDLSGSNLSGSDLSGSDLSGSNLRGSNLRGSNLRGSNLRGSNLSGSNLSGSDLSGTTCLSITGLDSGHAILAPLPEGWRLTIGCWNGTVQALRELIAKDDGWPEATGEQIPIRRRQLTTIADLCDSWTPTRQQALDEVQTKWAPAKTEASA